LSFFLVSRAFVGLGLIIGISRSHTTYGRTPLDK